MKNQESKKQQESFVRRVVANLTARALWEGLKALYEQFS